MSEEHRRKNLRVIEGGRRSGRDPDRDADLLRRLLEASEEKNPSEDEWLEERRRSYRDQIGAMRSRPRSDDRPLQAFVRAVDEELEQLEQADPETIGPLADLVDSLHRFLLWARRQLE